jgi:predicted transposase YdaD
MPINNYQIIYLDNKIKEIKIQLYYIKLPLTSIIIRVLLQIQHFHNNIKLIGFY